MRLNKIGFFGLGLIGGSIAKTIKQIYPASELIATASHKKTVEDAYDAGVIINEAPLPLSDFSDCDVIFLCAPVLTNIKAMEELAALPLKEDVCITDVGSVKGQVHEAAERLALTKNFIGGHPMAGSEKTGFENASPMLLENAYYLLTPEKDVPKKQVKSFVSFIKSIGSIPLVLDSKSHDMSTAGISHLPHIIAAGLVNFVQEQDDPDETMKRIAAGGFKDITRIASSSPEMWESILLSNREAVLTLLSRYEELISGIKDRIDASDGEGIREFFRSAKDYRDSLAVTGKNRSMIFELYCDLDDKEGQIALITTILAISHINLKNIGIVHNREYQQGALHIEFYDSNSLERAAGLLKSYGYTIYLTK